MQLVPTQIADVFLIRLVPIGDARGYFLRVFDLPLLQEVNPSFTVLRVSRSFTRTKGAIRGLHFQHAPRAEDKLVQCIRGAIFDVAVDIRPESPTYRQWVGFELSAENQEMLLVPKGCAHGFQTLTEDCLIEYFVTEAYSPQHEGGMRWDDPALAIEWPLTCTLTSEKDAAWPLLAP